MIPEFREAFNAGFTDSQYESYKRALDTFARWPSDFRIAESPLFLSPEFTAQLEQAADEILAQLQTPAFRAHSARAIPKGFVVPGEDAHPLFLQIDFGLCLDTNGSVVPRLIELQAFPSLYAFQAAMAAMMRTHFALPSHLTPYFGALDESQYLALLRRAIVAENDPRETVLLEIHPERQKTRIDFACTEKYLGVRTVDLVQVQKRGRSLSYVHEGREIPIRRIYNRVIFDELTRLNVTASFQFTDELDVSWAGHPNWYFRISKHTLPFLHGACVPECRFVSELKEYPHDLQNYVLKPLFSFAGSGVEVDVKKEKLDAIPARDQYILQRKVEYAPVLKTPDGYSKAEIRLMFIWEDKPLLVNNLVRLSKGRMMGVNFNKNKTWVGSSVAFHE